MAWIAFTAACVVVTPWLIGRVYNTIESWNQAWAEDNRD